MCFFAKKKNVFFGRQNKIVGGDGEVINYY